MGLFKPHRSHTKRMKLPQRKLLVYSEPVRLNIYVYSIDLTVKTDKILIYETKMPPFKITNERLLCFCLNIEGANVFLKKCIRAAALLGQCGTKGDIYKKKKSIM